MPLLADFRKSDNTHRTTVKESGDYKICFDNSLSRFSGKIVFFEIIVESNEDDEKDDEVGVIFAGQEKESELYDVKVRIL